MKIALFISLMVNIILGVFLYDKIEQVDKQRHELINMGVDLYMLESKQEDFSRHSDKLLEHITVLEKKIAYIEYVKKNKIKHGSRFYYSDDNGNKVYRILQKRSDGKYEIVESDSTFKTRKPEEYIVVYENLQEAALDTAKYYTLME